MKILLYKLLTIFNLASIFLCVLMLMSLYEFLKETYFNGSLTLWESHAITIVVTAMLSTLAAYFMRRMTNNLVKEAESAHAKVKSIITNLFDAVIIIDEHGIIQSTNPACEKIFGYNEKEMTGNNVKMLMPEPYASEHDNYINNYILTKIPKILGKSRREVPGLKSNGEIIEMDLITSKMVIDDRLMFIGIVRDITEYKKAENEVNRLRKSEKLMLEVLQSELSVAMAIQSNLLPKCYYLFPQFPQIQLYGMMRPAKEIGGDFYDAFSIDCEHIVIAIGDVAGKGIPAAMFMMETMTLLKSKITKPRKFENALVKINKALCENNDTNMFVTLFVGMLNVNTGDFYYVNGGHLPPLLKKINSDYYPLVTPNNMLLGIYDQAYYEIIQTQLHDGDTLILYTDGVTEAENSKKEFFSLSRMTKSLTSSISDVRFICNNIYADIMEFCGDQQQSDDITILALQFNKHKHKDKKFFDWSDEFSIGIDEIDEQHQTIINLINQLYDEAFDSCINIENFLDTLYELIRTTKIHFKTEERLFYAFKYQDAETHIKYHSEIMDKMIEIQNKTKGNNAIDNIDMLRFIKKWIEHHILIEDKKFFSKFN